MKRIFFLVLFCFCFINVQSQNKFTISGYVNEKGSKESLPGASIYLPDLKSGTVTNNYGFYSITIPANDSLRIVISFIGYQPQIKILKLTQNISLNVELSSSI
ncbi:MAG TPA: carboxypeptidase-like regulatory domain-containing protein, partial [Bacteroidia bacterium]|nr:carboxypeptidase-like regulatory domain-containing protein [Bacteroidia bacterium]